MSEIIFTLIGGLLSASLIYLGAYSSGYNEGKRDGYRRGRAYARRQDSEVNN